MASVIYGLYINTIGFQMGYENGLYAFTAAVLGGIGNIPGAVLGGLVLGLIRSLGRRLCQRALGRRIDLRHFDFDPGVPSHRIAWRARSRQGLSRQMAQDKTAFSRVWLCVELTALVVLAVLPLVLPQPLVEPLGLRVTDLFIFGILALGLNVVVGYTGILHLGIGAFFGIGAYITGILTVGSYPFQLGLTAALVASALGTAAMRAGSGVRRRCGCAAIIWRS